MDKGRDTILFIQWSMGYGGIEKSLVTLANGLIDEYDIDILVINGRERKTAEELDARIVVKFLAKGRLFPLAYQSLKLFPRLTRRLIGLRKSYDYEIIYNFLMEGNTAGLLNGSRNFAFIHSDLYHGTPFSALMNEGFKRNPKRLKRVKALIDRVDALAAVSDNAKEGFIDFFGARYANKITIFPNLFNVSEIIEHASEIIEPLSDAELKLVTVSRLDKGKNVIDLIKAQEILLSRGIDCSLTIVGDGPERESLESYVQGNGITGVSFTGGMPNPYPYIKSADIFAFASVEESMGLVIAEAMLLGLPVVSYRNRGAVSVFGDYIKTTPMNPEELAAAIIDEFRNHSQDIERSRKFAESLNISYAIEAFESLIEQSRSFSNE